jgi:hypothetical protein
MEKRCEEAGKIYRRGADVRESGLLTVVDDGDGRTRAPQSLHSRAGSGGAGRPWRTTIFDLLGYSTLTRDS